MAKEQGKRKNQFENNKFAFVKIAFSPDEQQTVSLWVEERNLGLEDAILEIADQRLKLTVSLNAWSGMYQASVTCKDKSRSTYNSCYTYEHSDVGRLVRIMVYFVQHVLGTDGLNEFVETVINDW